MHTALEHLYHELTGVRTGRASTAMLETINVEVYGERQSLTHVATVLMRGPRTLAVTVYDVGNVGPVMEAIRTSPLQLDPRLERGEIVVPVPECASAVAAAAACGLHQQSSSTQAAVSGTLQLHRQV